MLSGLGTYECEESDVGLGLGLLLVGPRSWTSRDDDPNLIACVSMLTSNMSVGSSKGGLHCMLENQGRVRLSSPFLPILGCDRTLERVFEVRMLVT
jgi:hypothetical protein